MIVFIGGSRPNKSGVLSISVSEVFNILDNTLKNESIERIISGGALGIDHIAEFYAEKQNIPFTEYLPDYKKYHPKRAPLIRNENMAEACDRAIFIWNEKSRGTKHAIESVRKLNKPFAVYNFNGNCLESTIPGYEVEASGTQLQLSI